MSYWNDDIPVLEEADRARQLEGLRAWSGKTDEQVLELAESGQLPDDPEYAEWLVLLHRGGLIAPER